MNKEELMKEILLKVHIKAMSKSHSKEKLKEEASKYEPMTMIGVGHVGSIVNEIITEYGLLDNK